MNEKVDCIKLYSYMVKKGCNCNELADISGLSRSTISMVKNGKRCKKETIIKIAIALDCKVEDLVE